MSNRKQGRSCKQSLERFSEREFFIDNLLVRIHFIIVMIRWTGLAPWEFEFPFAGSLTSTFLAGAELQTKPGEVLKEAKVRRAWRGTSRKMFERLNQKSTD